MRVGEFALGFLNTRRRAIFAAQYGWLVPDPLVVVCGCERDPLHTNAESLAQRARNERVDLTVPVERPMRVEEPAIFFSSKGDELKLPAFSVAKLTGDLLNEFVSCFLGVSSAHSRESASPGF